MKRNLIRYCLVIVLTGYLLQVNGQSSGGGPAFMMPSLAPQVHKDRTILFRLRAPAARKVVLKMETNILPMVRDKRGEWSVTTGVMEPDIYSYSFIVDSLSLPDPANPLMRSSYFASGQSLVIVPGSPPRDWELQEVPHGDITRHLYKSAVIGEEREYFVYTPPGYEREGTKNYPVIYLLHGMGDDARGWTQSGYAHFILDNLIYQHRALPMILVFTTGYGMPGGGMAKESFDRFSRSLTEEVMAMVEKVYHTDREASHRGIVGLSMGGAQAVEIGLNHPDLFSWVGGFSSAYIMYGIGTGNLAKINSLDSVYARTFPGLDSRINEKIKLLWISCGRSDFLAGNNKDFMKWLDKGKIQYHRVETEGAHSWMVWRRNLAEFVEKAFR